MTVSLSELAARRLRRAVPTEQDEAEYTERRARLVRAATQSRDPQRGVWRWLLLAFGAGSLAGWYAITLDRVTTFTAAGEPGRIGAFYAAPADALLPLRFGDGSEIKLAPGARARVVGTERERRALVLEFGSARADLRQQAGSTWEFSVGPYVIESSGAEFELSWDEALQRVALSVLSGAARVRGPGLHEARNLSGAEEFAASAAGGQR